LTVEDKSSPSLELASPSSSSGWSDFPEDSRETFFLSNAEAEDYHRLKRRRLLDEAWERRLKEREAEEADQSVQGDPDEDGEVRVSDASSAELIPVLTTAADNSFLPKRLL
jgi:hypothetical protein